ncbi:MAG: hypothetical protein WHT08_14905 [Bryobacteraceae bacterium]
MLHALLLALLAAPPDPSTLESHYGRLETDRSSYRPLERVRVTVTGRARGDASCRVRAADPDQRTWFERELRLENNRATVEFPASGRAGVHYLYLYFPGESRHSRYVNFRLVPQTEVRTGDPDFDEIFPFTMEKMQLGRRDYQTARGRFVGYISGDTWRFDGIWLRDWIYSLPAYRHWEREMQCGLDRFLDAQREDGMTPDGIHRDGRTWRVGLESDVEYILVLGAWQTWRATGDTSWMRAALPKLEKALAYVRSDPKHWDPRYRLVKRQHSCDTWDFDIDGAGDSGTSRHVIALCDQTGYYQAFLAMAEMHRAAGDAARAAEWEREAEEYRQRAAALLWDGVKFQHHVHLDPIDHGDFDERQQLAMSNTWAMTRGLATPGQARQILDEYLRRHRATGDKYPWWSLQPGYPDHLGYWKDPFRKQGGYANGGLMPWVGGELCRAAFWFGREAWGVELLRQYARHLRETGGVQVWYWPDGTPGFRTTNEVPYAGWGMAQWVEALLEGLAGVRMLAPRMEEVEVCPRWPAAGIAQAQVTFHLAASDAYFSYRWRRDASGIAIEYSGSGRRARFRVLLPQGFRVREVLSAGKAIPHRIEQVDQSRYVVIDALDGSYGEIRAAGLL